MARLMFKLHRRSSATCNDSATQAADVLLPRDRPDIRVATPLSDGEINIAGGLQRNYYDDARHALQQQAANNAANRARDGHVVRLGVDVSVDDSDSPFA